MSSSTLSQSIRELFQEAIAGKMEGADGTYFVEGPEGVLHAIGSLSAHDASVQVGSASSIAAHARHMAYYMELTCDFLDGNPQSADWAGSWSVQTVDVDQWEGIKSDLSIQVDRLLRHMDALGGNEPAGIITGAIAQVAHAAYHLGCINQMLRVIGAV